MACWCAGKCPHIAGAVPLIRQSKFGQAGALLRRVVAENPNCGEGHKALAFVLSETNHAAFAIPHIERAEKILGPTPAVLLDKTIVFRNAVRLKSAIAAARAALVALPDAPLIWAILASNLQADGELDEMDETLRQARAKFGNHPVLARVYAVAFTERKDYAAAVEVLNDSAAGTDKDPLSLFERGRCYEALGEYSKAWADWMRGKELQRAAGCIWNRELADRRFAMLADVARPRHFRDLQAADVSDEPQPIFIAGLPRSGTTMLEAGLAAHKHITGGDEMMALPDLLQAMPALLQVRLPYPRCMGALRLEQNRTAIETMRDMYLRKAIQKIKAGDFKPMARAMALWFTDKMPSNELHWPLISLLFPASPIIQTRRHPLDVMVSNMSHNLVHGGFISCGMESFARHMVMVEDLQAHYRGRLPFLNLHTVRYEQFVEDHQAGIDSLLPPGLDPDPACYDFHLSPWRSRTISHRQIKQKVNGNSVGRYKPFLEFLKPALDELQPLIERQGYAI